MSAKIYNVPFEVEQRMRILQLMKTLGVKRTEEILCEAMDPVIVKAIIKNTMRNYGW